MKREEQLRDVVSDIRLTCGDLMNFDEDCYIRLGDDDLVFQIKAFDDSDIYLRDITNRMTLKRNRYVVFNTCAIIGKEPELCDVLRWLSTMMREVFIDGQGFFFSRNAHEMVKTEYVKWDFTKSLLKQQSCEVISFLWATMRLAKTGDV